jgi:alanyl-tRNA synthetase
MTPGRRPWSGATALFGEKYGDEVRRGRMGHDPAPRPSTACIRSIVRRHAREAHGRHRPVQIVSEGAVSAGVRRVEAVTGEAALRVIEERDRQLVAASAALKARPEDLPERIAALVEERRKLEREVAELRKQLATGGGGAQVEEIGGMRAALRNLGEVPARDLKGLAEAILKGGTADIVALVSTAEGKASIVVALGDAAKGRADAVTLVRAASAAVGGKGGGGRPDMAQAGGPEADKAEAALEAVRGALAA